MLCTVHPSCICIYGLIPKLLYVEAWEPGNEAIAFCSMHYKTNCSQGFVLCELPFRSVCVWRGGGGGWEAREFYFPFLPPGRLSVNPPDAMIKLSSGHIVLSFGHHSTGMAWPGMAWFKVPVGLQSWIHHGKIVMVLPTRGNVRNDC